MDMGSPWRSKKAFLYFGGAFVIILGAIIVLNAPYNFVLYRAGAGEQIYFTLHDREGYYPKLEISLDLRSSNTTDVVLVDFSVANNETAQINTVNFTLTSIDIVPNSNPPAYVARQTIDISPGNYTITIDRAYGIAFMDVGLTQQSDSRLYIVAGGMMNIIGLFMGGAGYFVSGSFLPTGDEIIVDWGYEDEKYEN